MLSRPSRFTRIAAWCTTHRWQTFLLWVLALVAVIVAGKAAGRQDMSSFRLPGTESQRAYDVLARHAPVRNGGIDQLVFAARGSGKVADERPAIDAALAKVRRDPIVAGVGDPFRGQGQVTPDGRIAVTQILYKKDFDKYKEKQFERVEKAAFTARSPRLDVEHGGQGAEMIRFAHQGGSSEMIGVLVAALILLLTFGSAVAAGVPLVTAGFAVGIMLGAIPLISHLVDTPDFASQLATLIGLGVGIDYALIVLTRYRAEHLGGLDREAAILKAIDTAGRTVFFAGLTVIIALLGLLLLGLSFLHGPAVASALVVALAMLSALTLLPMLLSRAGDKIDRLRLPLPRRGRRDGADGSRWEAWAGTVQRRPWAAVAVSLVVLIGLALPALGMRLGNSDAGLDPKGTTTRKAYDTIARGFGPGVNGSFLIVTELPRARDAAAARAVYDAVRADPGVVRALPPQLSPDGAIATITLFPRTGPQDEKTTKLLNRLRDERLPPVEDRTGARVSIGGQTAAQEDFTDVISSKLPLFVGMVVLLSALLLMAVFRSVFIPVKAAAMNLLSIGAALGFVTLVFQNGVGANTLAAGEGPIESFVPVMLFAIVFGLSMDYEVFLVSRVHEEYTHHGDASRAVRAGLGATGRVITAAATIMVVVFLSFGTADDRVIKEFGLGLAMAVLLDALIIRCLLVPALMEIAGDRAWWLPRWIDRRLPKIQLEREEAVGESTA